MAKPSTSAVIVALVLAAVLALGFAVKRAYNKIRILNPGIRFISFSNPINFTIDVILVNDNDFKLSVTEYAGVVYYKGNELASFSTGALDIAPKSSTKLSIPGEANLLDTFINVLSIIKSKKLDTNLQIKSKLMYENILVPLNYDVSIL